MFSPRSDRTVAKQVGGGAQAPRRVTWIVDGGYLRANAPGRFDYLKLRQLLEGPGKRRFDEAYLLDGRQDQSSEKQEAYFRWLKMAAPSGPQFRLQLYPLKAQRLACPACGKENERLVQKGVDVGIATLLIRLAALDRYDRLLLSSGDGDLLDAVSYVKDECHKEIYLAVFKGSVSPDLQSVANRTIWLDEHWQFFKKDPPCSVDAS